MKKSIILAVVAIIFVTTKSFPQLFVQSGAKVYIQAPAIITVTGNVSTAASILGNGTVQMNGGTQQFIQTNTLSLPNLTINNSANVKLSGNIRVNGILNFTSGKVVADNFSVFLGESAAVTGAGAGKFIETNGSGQVRKMLNANITSYLLPVGSGNDYTPVSLTVSGSYATAFVAVKTKPAVHPNKPAAVTNYLNTYWTVVRNGISGSVNATATYTASNIVGNEATYKGFLWNGANWTKTGVTINTSSNQVIAPVNGASVDIYAMNDFVVASAGKLDAATGEKLFPNPTTSQSTIAFTIETGGPVNFSVFDIKGRLLQSKQVDLNAGYQQHTIDLSGYKPGTYEIRVRSSLFNKNYKVIKQ